MLLPFSSEEYQIPVCIADLPAHDFQVTPDTLTEEVVAVLEEHPDVSGVLVVEQRKLRGFLTRLKLFERLGHRYGIELFMRKPIASLLAAMQYQATVLPGNLRVDEAVHRALARPLRDMYDPVVVELPNGMYRILDVTVLVLAQSRTLASVSNVVGKLGQLDAMIYQQSEEKDILQRMLRLLGQVVPYHQAHVFAQKDGQLMLIAHHGLSNDRIDPNEIQANPIYEMMVNHRQGISLPDTRRVPAWQGLEGLGEPVSWLGLPFFDEDGRFTGFLALGRNVESPFTPDEKQTCQAFAQRILKALARTRQQAQITDDFFPLSNEALEWAELESALQ